MPARMAKMLQGDEPPCDHSATTAADTDGLSEKEILWGILQVLREQRQRDEQDDKASKADAERDSYSQVSSMYSAIAVFIASLGISFLSLAHDTFGDRPAGTPSKRSDDAIRALWYLSALFAIVSATASGLAASSAFMMKLADMDVQKYWGLYKAGRPPPGRRRWRGEWELQEIRRQDEIEPPNDALEERQSRTRGDKLAGFEGHPPTLSAGTETIVATDSYDDAAHEQDFVVMMTVVSLVFMVPSLVALLGGLLVFVWAELSLGVSVPVTIALGGAYLFLVFAQKVSMGTVLASLRKKRLQKQKNMGMQGIAKTDGQARV